MANPNVVNVICQGWGKRWNGVLCSFYESTTRACQLLRAHQMSAFWQQCRGAFEILYGATLIWGKKLQEQYPDLPIDDAEEIDFQAIIERLNCYQPDEQNLNVWQKYVHRTVYLELKGNLIRRGLLPGSHMCGTCKHLSQTKPYLCFQTGERHKKTTPPCDAYRPKLPDVRSLDDEEQIVEDGEHRHRRQSLLERVQAKIEEEQTSAPVVQFTWATEMLMLRAKAASPKSKAQQRYYRQEDVFLHLQHLLAQGINWETAETILAEKYQTSIKTIQRDISEIKQFLQEKMSSQ